MHEILAVNKLLEIFRSMQGMGCRANKMIQEK